MPCYCSIWNYCGVFDRSKVFPREFEVTSFPSTENVKDVLKGWLFKTPEKDESLVQFCRSEFFSFKCFFSHQTRSKCLALGVNEEKFHEGNSLSISSCSQLFFCSVLGIGNKYGGCQLQFISRWSFLVETPFKRPFCFSVTHVEGITKVQ